MRRTPAEITPATIAIATHALMRRGRNRKSHSVIEQWNHHWRGWDEAAVIFTFPVEGDFDYLIRCVAHGRHTLESTAARAEKAFRAPWDWCGHCRETVQNGHRSQNEIAAETVPLADEPSHVHIAEVMSSEVESPQA